MFTPAGKYITVGDLYIADGKMGVVIKKTYSKSGGYLIEMRWSSKTDIFVGEFTGSEVAKRIASGEWKYFSSYSPEKNEGK